MVFLNTLFDISNILSVRNLVAILLYPFQVRNTRMYVKLHAITIIPKMKNYFIFLNFVFVCILVYIRYFIPPRIKYTYKSLRVLQRKLIKDKFICVSVSLYIGKISACRQFSCTNSSLDTHMIAK